MNGLANVETPDPNCGVVVRLDRRFPGNAGIFPDDAKGALRVADAELTLTERASTDPKSVIKEYTA